jgi:hypothetical protein
MLVLLLLRVSQRWIGCNDIDLKTIAYVELRVLSLSYADDL